MTVIHYAIIKIRALSSIDVGVRRYSELKKLYGEQLCTHKNLFGRQEFPPHRGQVFCRFDEGVIEERRSAAEAMLLFTTNIPALYNIPQLKDFFRVRRKKHTQRWVCGSYPTPGPGPLPGHRSRQAWGGG
uniref:Sorting nexin 15 n=1 Tax=Hucho hucho TaxID=62062 RepID=A0A4W5QAK6_9TELE